MENKGDFQGVVCCCLNSDSSMEKTVIKLLDLKTSTIHHDIQCFNLELTNKYYQATIHLFDYKTTETDKKTDQLLRECQAIILICDGMKITTEQLDSIRDQLSSVQGEPRILFCEGTDENPGCPKSILEWCIQNGYDLINADAEDAKTQVLDSLSAYRWKYRTSKTDDKNKQTENKPELDDELMKKLSDFDSLLGKLSAYRDKPEMRGNADDKNIMEIAEILSGLLGDDVDDFLEEDSTT